MFGHKNFWSEKTFGWKKNLVKKIWVKKNCQAPPPFKETYAKIRAVGVPVGRRSGGRLATTLVATKNVFIFFLFPVFFSSPLSPFHIEGVLGSINLFRES